MYLHILKLIATRYLKYGLALLISLFTTALLSGLAVGLIAPIVDSSQAGGEHNLFIQKFQEFFQYFDISYSFLNMLILALAIVIASSE